ncbi:hypothetical protein Acr_00g0025630 [Actinidia rufa]|uniref:Helitron helicase-like domain-containing protein n=1 Tax=Actinidia rufa TaxID=165716 RepID=A0A7J0DFB0_9ERIC|nr:hypothetical protein Acr_00g0025630 [Actinidia rufa]
MPPPRNLGEAFLTIDVNEVITRQVELPLRLELSMSSTTSPPEQNWQTSTNQRVHENLCSDDELEANAFTSLGAKMDPRILAGRGPRSFTIHGELRHRTGALLPQPGHEGTYAQLYIYDPDSALNAYELLNQSEQAGEYLTAYLHYSVATDRRRYNLPTSDEIAVILPGDGTEVNGMRDIVLHLRGNNDLMRISECHPAYLPLHYVLLFPRGELGWEPQLKQWDVLRGVDKIRTCAQVDIVVSVEFPSPEDDPILFETVKSVMVHGPCGARNPNAPCLDNNGRCTKRYPRAFAEGTTMDQDGYPIYRRRNDGRVYTVMGQDVDNRDVVPYNAYLSKMFNCHINVEVCAGMRCVKYIHKYIYKGHDRTTMVLGGVDEIQQYIDSRYIGAPEAARRILGHNLHEEFPTVVRLALHLPGMHHVIFDETESMKFNYFQS